MCLCCLATACGDDDHADGPVSTIYGHRFVDLGLPSGLLWAECNIGASTPYDNGDYFAWGETEPKQEYSWSTYKWGDGRNFTKYTHTSLLQLEATDDAARVKWGKKCRMPSVADYDELHRRCKWTWKGNYNGGTSGFEVKGPNGQTIFFPIPGYFDGTQVRYHGLYTAYWSSSLGPHDKEDGIDKFALCMFVQDCVLTPGDYYYRYYGLPIRAVASK